MCEPMLGEIKLFAGNYPPRGWAFCDGHLISVAENPALFSILSNYYGGDGRTTFGLPDLRGRVPLGSGSAPGLTPRQMGQSGGYERVSINIAQMPAHSHPAEAQAQAAASAEARLLAANVEADTQVPTGNALADPRGNTYVDAQPTDALHSDSVQVDVTVTSVVEVAVEPVGGDDTHANMPPFQVVNYIIALEGYYPARS